jgi:hypothetical protein
MEAALLEGRKAAQTETLIGYLLHCDRTTSIR